MILIQFLFVWFLGSVFHGSSLLFQELEVKKAWEAYVESDEVANKREAMCLRNPMDIGNIATGMMPKSNKIMRESSNRKTGQDFLQIVFFSNWAMPESI